MRTLFQHLPINSMGKLYQPVRGTRVPHWRVGRRRGERRCLKDKGSEAQWAVYLAQEIIAISDPDACYPPGRTCGGHLVFLLRLWPQKSRPPEGVRNPPGTACPALGGLCTASQALPTSSPTAQRPMPLCSTASSRVRGLLRPPGDLWAWRFAAPSQPLPPLENPHDPIPPRLAPRLPQAPDDSKAK
jgi:hypothetical protein